MMKIMKMEEKEGGFDTSDPSQSTRQSIIPGDTTRSTM